jgi:hypothetical protein
MTSVKINVRSGLGNQILPLISSIYLCQKYNKNLVYYCDILESCDLRTQATINDFFIFPNICEKSKYSLTSNNCSTIIENKNIININALINDNILIQNCFHLFVTENEINSYKPQPKKNIIKTDYLINIQKILHNIDLIDELKQKIIETTKLFDENTISVHYRGAEESCLNNTKYQLEEFINSIELEKKIYLSSDCLDTELYIKNKFGSRILTIVNPFGGDNNKVSENKESIMNAICEVYILSKTEEFYGTKGSSFTFLSWLLSKHNILEFWN